MGYRYMQIDTVIRDNSGKEVHNVLTDNDLGVGRLDYIWDEIFEEKMKAQDWYFLTFKVSVENTSEDSEKQVVACSKKCKDQLAHREQSNLPIS